MFKVIVDSDGKIIGLLKDGVKVPWFDLSGKPPNGESYMVRPAKGKKFTVRKMVDGVPSGKAVECESEVGEPEVDEPEVDEPKIGDLQVGEPKEDDRDQVPEKEPQGPKEKEEADEPTALDINENAAEEFSDSAEGECPGEPETPCAVVRARTKKTKESGLTRTSDIKTKGFSGGKLKTHYEKHGGEFLKQGSQDPVTQARYLNIAKEYAAERGDNFDEVQIGDTYIRIDPREPEPEDEDDIQTTMEDAPYNLEDPTRPRRVLVMKDREIRTFYIWKPQYHLINRDNPRRDPLAFAIEETLGKMEVSEEEKEKIRYKMQKAGIDLS